MNSEVPSPKDLRNQSLSVAGIAQNSQPVDTIIAPDNVRQFYDATLEMHDLSKQLNSVAHRLESSHKTTRFHILGWFVVLLFYPLLMIAGASYMPSEWKLKTIELMMKTESAWEAGQSILAKANNQKFEKHLTGYSIISGNVEKIEGCIGIAKTLKRPIECPLLIDPERMK
jgi:hypothetical protein